MEKEIEVSKEFEIAIKFEGGKLILSNDYEGKIGGAKLELSVNAGVLVDAITKAIPGQIDDQLGELLKAGLSKL